jgi:hypothetical protein
LVIIVNFNVCEHEKYQMALAEFAGMVEKVDTPSASEKAAWYAIAQANIEENVGHLQSHPQDFADVLQNQYNRNIASSESNALPVPSKRTRGKKHTEENALKLSRNESQGVKEPSNIYLGSERRSHERFSGFADDDLESMNGLVLEMFSFARVVVDEYTYVNIPDALTIMNIKADCYWALSGTTPHKNHQDANSIARFLRVTLGVPDFANMNRDVLAKIQGKLTGNVCRQTL